MSCKHTNHVMKSKHSVYILPPTPLPPHQHHHSHNASTCRPDSNVCLALLISYHGYIMYAPAYLQDIHLLYIQSYRHLHEGLYS